MDGFETLSGQAPLSERPPTSEIPKPRTILLDVGIHSTESAKERARVFRNNLEQLLEQSEGPVGVLMEAADAPEGFNNLIQLLVQNGNSPAVAYITAVLIDRSIYETGQINDSTYRGEVLPSVVAKSKNVWEIFKQNPTDTNPYWSFDLAILHEVDDLWGKYPHRVRFTTESTVGIFNASQEARENKATELFQEAKRELVDNRNPKLALSKLKECVGKQLKFHNRREVGVINNALEFMDANQLTAEIVLMGSTHAQRLEKGLRKRLERRKRLGPYPETQVLVAETSTTVYDYAIRDDDYYVNIGDRIIRHPDKTTSLLWKQYIIAIGLQELLERDFNKKSKPVLSRHFEYLGNFATHNLTDESMIDQFLQQVEKEGFARTSESWFGSIEAIATIPMISTGEFKFI